ncbi:hypothetical protein GX48_07230 [Paracoccidioides brasiliensis]|nr:hypothetical protein GX48_07230 [Paracoccidioides brasiliensis]
MGEEKRMIGSLAENAKWYMREGTRNLKDGPYSIIQIPRSTATAVFVSSVIQRMPRVLVRQRALDKDALILSRLLGLVTSPDQLSCLPSVQFHPPATGPGCGYRNLQTSPTKGCPLIWFYDLGADVQGAEDRFKELTTKD